MSHHGAPRASEESELACDTLRGTLVLRTGYELHDSLVPLALHMAPLKGCV